MLPGPDGLLGRVIGGYRLNRLLGSGGTGAVFLGQGEESSTAAGTPPEQVAIKVLIPPMQLSTTDQAEFRARFRREAEALRQLRHPHILSVLALGEDEVTGLPYMVLPYLDGGTLATRLAQGALPLTEASQYFAQLAEALDYAHGRMIIHRDIKPANILLDQQGQVYLADFGLVKLFDGTRTTLTTTGQVMGTPEYMGPEQARGDQIGPAADIYSAGIVLYQMVTGRLPFQGKSLTDVLLQIVQSAPPAPRQFRADLPEPAEAAILRALAKNPEARLSSVGALSRAFALGIQGQWSDELRLPAAPMGQTIQAMLPPTIATPPSALYRGIDSQGGAIPTAPPTQGGPLPTMMPPQQTQPQPPQYFMAPPMSPSYGQQPVPPGSWPTMAPSPYAGGGWAGAPPPAAIPQQPGRRWNRIALYLCTVLVVLSLSGVGAYLHFRPAQTGGSGNIGNGGVPTATTTSGVPLTTGVKGGTLVDGFFGEPDSLMPGLSSFTFGDMAQQLIWAPLFVGDDTLTIRPVLATAVPSTSNGGISADGKTYTIHMRSGVKWSDGSPLTSADALFTLKTMMDPTFGLHSALDVANIASVAAPDPLTLTINLKAPESPFLALGLVDPVDFAPIPQSVYGAMRPADIGKSQQAFLPPVVSGPFKITERIKGDHLSFVRNDNYFDAPRPYLDAVTIKIITDQATLLAALQSGIIATSWDLSMSALDSYKAITGYTQTLDKTPGTWEGLFLNTSNPILADVRVRQAIAKGLDLGPIQSLWNGLAKPTCTDAPGTWAADNQLAPCYQHDPQGAGALLDQAGWVMGSDGFRHKNGQTLELRYTTTASRSYRVQTQQIAKQQLAQIGIKIDTVGQNAATFFGQTLYDYKAYDLVEFADFPGWDPDDHTFFMCNQLTSAPGGFNVSHYCNSQVDANYQIELTNPDQAVRKAAFTAIHTQILQDVPVIWLYTYSNIAVYKNTVHNYSPAPSGETWNIAQWWCTGGAC